jgi:hypothetical protein
MDAIYLSASIGENASLCIAPLTKRRMLACGHSPSDASGYYLYQCRDDDPDSAEIIAHIESEDAAVRLGALLSLR